MIGQVIIKLEETDSTNHYALGLLNGQTKPKDGTVIIADSQTLGKGCGNSRWESEAGKNLTFSIVLYPKFLPLERQFILNKVVSLAIFDMLSASTDGNKFIKIKWPNDIYVGQKKISGTLIENAIAGNSFIHAVIGIGININQEKFGEDIPNPVSLKQITGKEHNLEDCLKTLFDCLDNRYQQLINNEYELLDNDYLTDLYLFGQNVLYNYKEQIITAKITGVNEQGQLQLEKDNGQMLACNFKEVEFVHKV